jgi:hypothetical protein
MQMKKCVLTLKPLFFNFLDRDQAQAFLDAVASHLGIDGAGTGLP